MSAERFAGRLRELREAAGLSREQLAERAGMKVNGVRDLEQGVRSPRWDSVLALAGALGVKCDDFAQEPGELPPPKAGRPRKAPTEGDGEKAKKIAARPKKRKGAK
jgi:transcriptional regulator with XRE-family HTH domain